MIDPDKTIEHVVRQGDKVRIVAGKGYMRHVQRKALLTLTDTGNGYIAHAKSFSSCDQDAYVCLSYCNAHSLWLALSAVYGDDA